jgi:hypothetical protein
MTAPISNPSPTVKLAPTSQRDKKAGSAGEPEAKKSWLEQLGQKVANKVNPPLEARIEALRRTAPPFREDKIGRLDHALSKHPASAAQVQALEALERETVDWTTQRGIAAWSNAEGNLDHLRLSAAVLKAKRAKGALGLSPTTWAKRLMQVSTAPEQLKQEVVALRKENEAVGAIIERATELATQAGGRADGVQGLAEFQSILKQHHEQLELADAALSTLVRLHGYMTPDFAAKVAAFDATISKWQGVLDGISGLKKQLAASTAPFDATDAAQADLAKAKRAHDKADERLGKAEVAIAVTSAPGAEARSRLLGKRARATKAIEKADQRIETAHTIIGQAFEQAVGLAQKMVDESNSLRDQLPEAYRSGILRTKLALQVDREKRVVTIDGVDLKRFAAQAKIGLDFVTTQIQIAGAPLERARTERAQLIDDTIGFSHERR